MIGNPLSTPLQSHVLIDSKGKFHAKPRVAQSRAGMKNKILQRHPMLQSHGEPEQPNYY